MGLRLQGVKISRAHEVSSVRKARVCVETTWLVDSGEERERERDSDT